MHSSGKGRQELTDILNKYRSGKATEEEKAFVEKYFDYLERQPDVLDSLSDEEKRLLAEEIGEKLRRQVDEGTALVRPLPATPRWQKIAVAAAVVAIIVAGSYLWRKQAPDTNLAEKVQPTLPNDKAPGGNKATLTLADGSTIVLDSLENGTLAHQGNARVSKLQNGQLSYQLEQDGQISTLYNTLNTPRGGQHKVILSDGTAVWLNAASSITYPTTFTGEERVVSITGEAYFEVAKMKGMPFKVKAGKMEVAVLGTHFNIMAYNDEPSIRTTLLEGSVKISAGGAQRLMKPGQQVDINSQGVMRDLPHADPGEAIAWKNGMFRFNGTDLKVIMRQVARWYDMEIEYNGNPGDVQFSGIVSRKEYVSQLLKILETTGSVHFTIEGKKIRVTPSENNY